MREKHKILLNKLKEALENDSRYIALIILGSLATGKAREDSDVDLCLIASDEEFKNVSARKDYYFGNSGPFEDEEIEIDGKVVNMQYLIDATKNGNEPVRESFRDAFTLFDHSGKVTDILKEILVYPEEERLPKLKKFYSLFECNQYYATQALKLNNDYLRIRCITETVYYAVRLVLSYNRIYFPCHKSMFDALDKAENLPDGFIEKSKELLNNVTEESLDEYFDLVYEFVKELKMTEQETVGLILEDEWSWFIGNTPACCL